MIEAVFLDAGGVIIDESEFERIKAQILTDIISKVKIYTISDYWNDTEEAVYRFVSSTYEYVLFKNLKDKNQYDQAFEEYKLRWKERKAPFKLMPGLKDLLERVSRDYKIGILGQYGNDFKMFLQEQDILSFFSFQQTQASYSITKPDPRYFEAILKEANCMPEKSIMVGDRIDKDIIPANVLKMKTIRLRTGLHAKQEPRIPLEIPNMTISSLSELTKEKIAELGCCV